MDKKKIIKSTISLIIVGLITKIFASIAKIIMARRLSNEAMGIYMLVTPIYIFFINIIQLNLPTIIGSKIASNRNKAKKIMITSSVIALVVNISFMLMIILTSPFIASKILKNSDTTLSLISLALLVPLISLGGLIKGYYLGIGKVEIPSYSQISEEIARIIFILLFTSMFIDKGPKYLAYGAFLSLSAGEIFSLTHMIVSLPNLKNKPKLLFNGIKDKDNYLTKEILSSSLPLTCGKFIATVAYSLEPIIVTNVLLNAGFSSAYITTEYGLISGYAFPLLLMPGFFANAFSRVLLHPLSTYIGKKDYTRAKKLIIYISLASLTVGLCFSFVLLFFNRELMLLLYKSTFGSKYVKVFAFPILLYYIEAPLLSAMLALNKSRKIMFFDMITSIIRVVLLFVLLPKIQIMSVGITIVITSSLLVLMMIIELFRFFQKNK